MTESRPDVSAGLTLDYDPDNNGSYDGGSLGRAWQLSRGRTAGTVQSRRAGTARCRFAARFGRGRNRRVIENQVSGESTVTVHYSYNTAWQMIEAREGEPDDGHLGQFLWSQRYVDALVIRWHDGNWDGDFADAGDSVVYYTDDANHNVTALVDPSGGVAERYVYDPYGNMTVLDADWSADADGVSDVGNPVGFAGYRYDVVTGLSYVRERYYDATLGRFVTRDPVQDGMNLYEYVSSGPMGATDPMGLAIMRNTYDTMPSDTPWPLTPVFAIPPSTPIQLGPTLDDYIRAPLGATPAAASSQVYPTLSDGTSGNASSGHVYGSLSPWDIGGMNLAINSIHSAPIDTSQEGWCQRFTPGETGRLISSKGNRNSEMVALYGNVSDSGTFGLGFVEVGDDYVSTGLVGWNTRWGSGSFTGRLGYLEYGTDLTRGTSVEGGVFRADFADTIHLGDQDVEFNNSIKILTLKAEAAWNPNEVGAKAKFTLFGWEGSATYREGEQVFITEMHTGFSFKVGKTYELLPKGGTLHEWGNSAMGGSTMVMPASTYDRLVIQTQGYDYYRSYPGQSDNSAFAHALLYSQYVSGQMNRKEFLDWTSPPPRPAIAGLSRVTLQETYGLDWWDVMVIKSGGNPFLRRNP